MVLAVVLWNLSSPPSLAERGLALAVVERDLILEELPEPSGIRDSPTSVSRCGWFFRCRNTDDVEVVDVDEPHPGRFNPSGNVPCEYCNDVQLGEFELDIDCGVEIGGAVADVISTQGAEPWSYDR